MSISFVNSTARVYNDKELNRVNTLLFSNGVFNTTGENLKYWETLGDFFVDAPGGNMNIRAKAGSATVDVEIDGVIQKIIIDESSQLSATVNPNADIAIRSDAVVLRVIQSVIDGDTLDVNGNNAISLVVISGSSASILTDNEIAVALNGDSFVRLANIAVPQSTTEITNEMITDARSLVSISRSTKLSGDAVQISPISEDPKSPKKGDVWYNSTENILKFFDGTNVSALQTQAFNWGYYPPNGNVNNTNDFTPEVENNSDVGLSQLPFYSVTFSGSFYSLMVAQLFKMPSIANPLIRIKMGNPSYPANVSYNIYSVDGSNNPSVLIQSFPEVSSGDVPRNDYHDLYLNASLYTPGVNYVITIHTTSFSNFDFPSYLRGEVKISSFTNSYLLGVKSSGATLGLGPFLEYDPLNMPWSGSSYSSGTNFVMQIFDVGEYRIGQTDVTGKTNRIKQTFLATFKDVNGFSFIKANNVGTPTGDLYAYLYKADEYGNPSGNILSMATIKQDDYAEINVGEDVNFEIKNDDLVVGSKYVVVVDTEYFSNVDNYTFQYSNSADGSAGYFNTADGWVDLSGNFFSSVYSSSMNKIVVTDNAGKIPSNLISVENLLKEMKLAYQQELSLSANESIASNEITFGSMQDGSAFFVYLQGDSSLYRFEKDEITGQFIETHKINPTLNIPAGDNGAILNIGDYIYVFSNNDTNVVCSRFLASDLTGETIMSVPTVPCTGQVGGWVSGENEVHIVSGNSQTTSRKWSLSGTNFSAVSTTTVPTATYTLGSSILDDLNRMYFIKTTSGNLVVNKLLDSGGANIESKTYIQNQFANNQSGSFIINIDNSRMYIGFIYSYFNETSQGAVRIHLIPVSKF